MAGKSCPTLLFPPGFNNGGALEAVSWAGVIIRAVQGMVQPATATQPRAGGVLAQSCEKGK